MGDGIVREKKRVSSFRELHGCDVEDTPVSRADRIAMHEDQCLKCYYVSDRSNDIKQIRVCDHTLHDEWWGYDIVREIPKDYYCLHFNDDRKPVFVSPIQHKQRGRPKKIKDIL